MPYWWCRCRCGACREVIAYHLTSGHSRSCGCAGKEKAARLAAKHCKKHGCASGGKPTPEYAIWTMMRQRCLNPNTVGWKNYGGRGITICDEWRDSFEAFYRDMGSRPSSKHMIDRINNDKGYSKGNCAWRTRKEQNANRRNVVFIEHDGKRMTAADWSRETGVPHVTIMRRFKKGLPIPVVLSNGWVKGGRVYERR